MNSQLTETPLHHTHRSFMLNMSRAAGEPFEQSAKKWRVDRLGISGDKLNCQVCNTALNNYVVLVNRDNSNRIIIGHNCYDKLIRFIQIGKVESALDDRHAHTNKLKAVTAELVNHTVIGWFLEELSAGRISSDLGDIISHIHEFGFAPSVEDAQKVVDYYKNHRAVFVEKMVPEARRWRLRKFIPNHIRIGYVDRLHALIMRSEAIHRDLASLRAIRVIVRIRLKEMLAEVHGMIKHGHQEAVVTEELELIVERIQELLGPCNQRWFARVALAETKELGWWIDQVRPLTWKMVYVYRSSEGRFYTQHFVTRTWVEILDTEMLQSERLTKSGLYEAYYSRYHHTILVTTVRVQFVEHFRIVKLDTPQPGSTPAYLGRMGKQKVIPIDPTPPGTYLSLLIQRVKGGSLVFTV